MLSVTIKAKNLSDLRQQASDLCSELECLPPTNAKAADAAPKKAAKAAKAKAAAEPKTEAAEPAEQDPSIGKKEKVMEALQSVNSSHGILVAKKMLEKFSCARISELKASDYDAFIQACQNPSGSQE